MTNWQRNTWVYVIDSVLNWFYIPIGVWVLIWSQDLSWSQIAWVYSLSLFWELVVELPSGALADLIGRKKTVLVGRVANVLGYLLFAFTNAFPGYVLAKMLYQTNWAMESGALSALMFDSLKENNKGNRYRQIEATTFLYCTLGMAIASILGGLLYLVNERAPYWAMIGISSLSLLAALFYNEPLVEKRTFSFRSWITQSREGFSHIFRNKHIRRISVFSVLVSFIGYTGLWYLYEPRLAAGGFSGTWLGLLVAGTYVMRAIGTKLIGRVIGKLGEARIPGFLVGLQILGSALSFIGGPLGAVMCVYFRKFADGFRVPILLSMQNKEIESKYRATSLSAITLLTNVLVAGVGPLIGWANSQYGIAVTLGSFTWVGLITLIILKLAWYK